VVLLSLAEQLIKMNVEEVVAVYLLSRKKRRTKKKIWDSSFIFGTALEGLI